MEWGTVLGWIGGVMSTAIIFLLKAHLEARKEERRNRRTTNHEDRQRRIETDRAIYGRLLTILVRSNLAAFIRSGKWRTDEEDLLLSLEQGAYEDFIDPDVNSAWVPLVTKTVELARKRRSGTIVQQDIQEYNQMYRAWEDAAKRSFGPLPETPVLTPMTDEAPWSDKDAA